MHSVVYVVVFCCKGFYICKLLLNVLFKNDCVYLLEEEQQESEFWRKNKIKSNGEGNAYLFPTQNP